jgi:hypothetical protein
MDGPVPGFLSVGDAAHLHLCTCPPNSYQQNESLESKQDAIPALRDRNVHGGQLETLEDMSTTGTLVVQCSQRKTRHARQLYRTPCGRLVQATPYPGGNGHCGCRSWVGWLSVSRKKHGQTAWLERNCWSTTRRQTMC